MANTKVANSVALSSDNVHRVPFGPYWHNTSIGAVILVNADLDLRVARTTDKGASWDDTNIFTGSVQKISCYFDKETPGNTGTLLHITWFDLSDRIYYRSYNLATGSFGTERNIEAVNVTVDTSNSQLSITVSRAGNIHIIYMAEVGTTTNHLRSDDGGATWDSLADPFEEFGDGADIYPANTSDDADICCLYLDTDVGAEAVSVKMWDNSVGDWTETAIVSATNIIANRRQVDAVTRISDGHLIAGIYNDFNTATGDYLVFDLTVNDIDSPTVTAKTNVVSNDAQIASFSWINQQTDELRFGWIGGTILSAAIVHYKVSTDGGGTWGSIQTYSENADDFRLVHAGRAVFSTGGRFQPSFYEADLFDIWINEVNDVEIEAVPITFIPSVMIV